MLNKFLFTLALEAGATGGLWAQEPMDTVVVIPEASEVTVVNDGEKTLVNATFSNKLGVRSNYEYEVNMSPSGSEEVEDEYPDNWGMDLPFISVRSCKDAGCGSTDRAKVKRAVTFLRHLYWGWRFNYGDKSHLRNSFEVGVRDVVGLSWKRRGAEFEIGLGFGMKRLLANGGYNYMKVGDAIQLLPVVAGHDVKISRLDVWSFHLPLLYNQSIYKEISFSVGGVLNFNTYAKSNLQYYDGNHRYKTEFKHLQQNFFTADVYASLNVWGIGVYGSWSPMKLFKNGFGPEVKAFTLGVEINY